MRNISGWFLLILDPVNIILISFLMLNASIYLIQNRFGLLFNNRFWTWRILSYPFMKKHYCRAEMSVFFCILCFWTCWIPSFEDLINIKLPNKVWKACEFFANANQYSRQWVEFYFSYQIIHIVKVKIVCLSNWAVFM